MRVADQQVAHFQRDRRRVINPGRGVMKAVEGEAGGDHVQVFLRNGLCATLKV